MNKLTENQIRIIASPRTWIEGEALRQFHAAARLESVGQAIGFPDLHPGQGVPVGAAFVTDGVIYPHLIGGDIGCGMALWQTDLLRRTARLDRWAELRFDLEHPWEGSIGGWLQDNALPSTAFDAAMGTLGGGNHFAELQAVERVSDTATFAALGLERDRFVALVHSGSHGFGESIFRNHALAHGTEGIAPDSKAGTAYLRAHDTALRWARANRELIVRRFFDTLGAQSTMVWDGCHNSILPRTSGGETVWIHRKGAVSAETTAVVIPGSRGTLSYLVQPLGDGFEHAWSLAHGAGRKWSRSESRQRVRARYRVAELVQTPLGGRVICEPRDLLYEEAPLAYKPIETVINDLVNVGLVRVIATLRPVLTYKTRAVRR